MQLTDHRGFRRLMRYSRALPGSMLLVAAGLAVLFVTLTALAQAPYAVPANARSGRMTTQQFPVVTIDGTHYRMAPGGRIYNANHTTVTPNQVPQDSAVKFVLNSDGQIQTVWLVGPQ